MEEKILSAELVQPEEIPASIRKPTRDEETPGQLRPGKFPKLLLLILVPLGLFLLLKLMILALVLFFMATIGFTLFRVGSRFLRKSRRQ